MGLFGRGKKDRGDERTAAGAARPAAAASEAARTVVSGPIAFYNECVEDYHRTAQAKGFAGHGVILIPELLPFGERAVLTYLKNEALQRQFANRPQVYYYLILSMAIRTGMVFAQMWHMDYERFKDKLADLVIAEGPASYAGGALREIGLPDENKAGSFFMEIFRRWVALHEPYWKLRDPRDYTYRAMVAGYQLGVSMMLEKLGY